MSIFAHFQQVSSRREGRRTKTHVVRSLTSYWVWWGWASCTAGEGPKSSMLFLSFFLLIMHLNKNVCAQLTTFPQSSLLRYCLLEEEGSTTHPLLYIFEKKNHIFPFPIMYKHIIVFLWRCTLLLIKVEWIRVTVDLRNLLYVHGPMLMNAKA